MYIYVVGIVSKYAEVYYASFYFLFSFLFLNIPLQKLKHINFQTFY